MCKKLRTLTILAALCLPLSLHTYAQSTLRVTVEGIDEPRGKLMVALYNNASTFMDSLYQGQILEVNQTGPQVAIFAQLPRGTYAISVYHDENANGKLDTGLFGIPKEPYGFSQNPTITFSPPSFEKAGFAVEEEKVEVVIRLR